ncbi:MAG: VOC family protein [Solirubrobacteraceae bacterium]
MAGESHRQLASVHGESTSRPHWGVCFAVADCDATAAKARELGATVTNEPVSMPIGRFAGLIDPQGASFTVMQAAE